ncbi:NAD(P)-binding protein [Punctularia strigosozonata HHB-11173 SS5]|uniref:NAD(P)-binding protein n=1 Tax=Punctularia strigosozonata (strain HHB-11173) TaxID=741275 RepID=UPI0004417B7C|nr:NAD(P)-binding protein [Punctularia strigosozonata HHB-11173 SS5]EIN09840.1 NAD(P)-binding protein [Punctularia strigosozonata HHB-11173 SS5]
MPLDTTNPATLMSGRFRRDQIPPLKGRTAVVTGGSAGIGYYAALNLARAGAKVHILSSTPEHGMKAEHEMNEEAKMAGGSVTFHQVDFGDLRQVDQVAKELAKEDRLDILINNAGVGQGPHGFTKDGLESHFQVNNLAHWLLTVRLLPLMQKTVSIAPPASVRICDQSSELHRAAPPDTQFASKEEIQEKRDPNRLYGRSKLGMILLGRQIIKRYPAVRDNILVTAVHPGTVDTDLQEGWAETYGVAGKIADVVMRKVGKSAEEGAEACLWAATSTDITPENFKEFQGNYYSEPYGKPGTETDQAKDEALGDRFWALCQLTAAEILGEHVA